MSCHHSFRRFLINASAIVLGAISSASLSYAQVRDSTDYESPGTSYEEVVTRPLWQDIQDKPSYFQTIWDASFISGLPDYFPTRWSDIQGIPETFLPEEHDHDDRYLRLSGGSVSGSLRAPSLNVDWGSGRGALNVHSNHTVRPEILLRGHGLLAAEQNLSLIAETGSNGISFRTGGITHSSSSEIARISPQGDIIAERRLIARDGVRARAPYVPGDELDVFSNLPIGLSYHASSTNDPSYPTGYGTVLTVHNSSARAFQLLGAKAAPNASEDRGLSELYYRSCNQQGNDGALPSGGVCYDWTRVLTEDPVTQYVGIGTTTPGRKLHVVGDARVDEGRVIIRDADDPRLTFIHPSGHDAHVCGILGSGADKSIGFSGRGVECVDDPVVRFVMGGSGEGNAHFEKGQLYSRGHNTVSDARFKNNIEPLRGSLEQISKLKPVRFDWKDRSASDLGFLAQEVREVFPQIVVADEDGYLSVNYSSLIAPLVSSVQALDQRTSEIDRLQVELQQRIADSRAQADRLDRLEQENRALKEKLERLEAMVADLAN